VAALEGGTWGLGYASGLAAVDGVARLLRPGDRVVLGDDAYGGTHRYFTRVLADFGVAVETRDLTDPTRWRFRNTSMVWLETPTNPGLRIVDVVAVAKRAHDAGPSSSWTTPSPRPTSPARCASGPTSWSTR
jgi:cystathionine beta-lyase/cystathionine gamma-synthase